MQSVNDIRQTFLDYFSSYSHEIVSSSSLVPLNDPTLMFANSGMVQFKNVFTGVEEKKFKRAVTSQKCVRAGGKHNDLENVGYTARHHTFFEMLGNFSFGDYFKEYAIELAWNLVTKQFLLDRDKLLVTVHSSDEEAAVLWKKIAGLSDKSIIRISTSDNFWAMGDTGPCGPCSEIFFDHGEHIFGGPPGSKNEDGDRFIEIWNLVFMQFEQISKEKRVEFRNLVAEKSSMDSATAEGQADNERFSHLIYRCILDESGKRVFKDKKSYEEEGNQPFVLQAASALAEKLYGLDPNYDQNLTENKFLRDYKFADDKNRLINAEGHLIDVDDDGVERLINEEGRFVAYKDDGEQYFVDRDGTEVSQEGEYSGFTPFLDDSGKPVPVPEEEKEEEEEVAEAEEKPKPKRTPRKRTTKKSTTTKTE